MDTVTSFFNNYGQKPIKVNIYCDEVSFRMEKVGVSNQYKVSEIPDFKLFISSSRFDLVSTSDERVKVSFILKKVITEFLLTTLN